MTAKEIRLVVIMLEQYSDQHLSSAGCNDTPHDWVEEFTEQEMIDLDREYHVWNGDPGEHDGTARYLLPDFCYVSLMRHKLAQAAKEMGMAEPHLTAIFDTGDQQSIAACADATGWRAESLARYAWELSKGTSVEIAREELSHG